MSEPAQIFCQIIAAKIVLKLELPFPKLLESYKYIFKNTMEPLYNI